LNNKPSERPDPCPCTADKSEAYLATASTGTATARPQSNGEVLFQIWPVQAGQGPHVNSLVYASDDRWDAFHSDIHLDKDYIRISDTGLQTKFGINVRWNVEGFGAGYILADNAGEHYTLPGAGQSTQLNLSYELAHSRNARNYLRQKKHRKHGWRPSHQTRIYNDLAVEMLDDAAKVKHSGEKCARIAQKALYYAMWCGEMLELDYARWHIEKRKQKLTCFIGCDARQYFQAEKEPYMQHFGELFNYANISFVVNGDRAMNELEPIEGQLNLELRDILVRRMGDSGIKVGGRALFWFHKWVTPDWLRSKNFSELKKYVEKHTRDVVGHFGDRIYAWEITNEFHDWANAVGVTPEQAVELTALACDIARDTAPGVKLLINNCCPFAEYVQMGEWSSGKAKYPQRTPWQFTRDLVEAGVDFDLIGQQMYFPYRDIQDSLIYLERYAQFNKKMQLSEVGVTSGPKSSAILTGRDEIEKDPYIWHRPWDEELQADWLEQIYTLGHSLDFVEAINWFDFIDYGSYMRNGGLISENKWQTKPGYERLTDLKKKWSL